METRFSFFKKPISNKYPNKSLSLLEVYGLIKGDEYEVTTDFLRGLVGKKEITEYKQTNFNYVTFSGVFRTRGANELIRHSNLICIDFDHIEEIGWLWDKLLIDEYFKTMLMFRSPSGHGIKWIVEIDIGGGSHLDWFLGIEAYIQKVYGISIDKSGKDIGRACFLCHDKNAYINPKLLTI